MFATTKLLLVWLPLGAISGLIGIPWTLLTGDIGPMYRAAMTTIALGLRAAGIRVEVSGLEHVPAGRPCLFLANHVSNLDPPVLLPVLPGRCSVLLKKELMAIPILGTAMRLGKYVPVERGARREAARESVRAAAEALRSGLHILIFPEGTRSPDGRLARFKKGPFYLGAETGAPIVPVAVSGTERMMRKGSSWIHPGAAMVKLLPVIEPADYATRDELMAAVHAALAAALPAGMRPEPEQVLQA